MSNIEGMDELKDELPKIFRRDVEETSSRDKIRFENGDIDLERMADEVHQIWSEWMEYMFAQGSEVSTDGPWIMAGYEKRRWKQQMKTPYAQLTEHEKQSERDIARRYLNIAWAPGKEQ